MQIIFGFKNVIQVDGKRELEAKLIESGAKIICELKRAFAFMAMGVKGYYKPTQLLDAILDDTGTSLEQGQQRDLNEFNDILLTRINEAINNEIETMSLTYNPNTVAGVNFLTDLLDGEHSEIRSYTDMRTGQQVIKRKSQRFFNINLNMAEESDIYRAWDKDHSEVISDYQHTEGQPRVELTKTSFI